MQTQAIAPVSGIGVEMPGHPEAMLEVARGLPDISVIPLVHEVSILGSTAAANVILENPYVSRRHAQIEHEEGRFEIQDVGSKNGTLVNGIRLSPGERHRLNSGDRIELAGGQVVLIFKDWGSTATLPPMDLAKTHELRVDGRSREVWLGGNKLVPPLSRKEFDVLSLLYRQRGEACSKDEIALSGWPERTGADVFDQDIEQCIRRLRLRIEPDPSSPRHIVTVRGYGYKLSLD